MTTTPQAPADPSPSYDAAGLVAELRRVGITDVDDSTLARALYSTDASLYRLVPTAVVRPRDADELVGLTQTARALGVPITMRGAGTSIAGNSVGPGLVVDTAKHLHRVHAIDPERRTAVVDPGVVHASLQRAAAPHGLRFGPDPSTHTRCTIGGMIGNNACGSRALGYGRTVDTVRSLTAVLGTGEVVTASDEGPATGAAATALHALVDGDLAHVRTHFGRFTRQVSGYSLEHLLPEHRRLDRFLVGSEGTLGVITRAEVDLVSEPPVRTLVVLGYPSMADAADAVPSLLRHPLVACEGLDARIVDCVRRAGKPVPELPKGAGWLFAEVVGASVAETDALAAAIALDAGALGSRVVHDAAESAALWRIREDGAGLAARSLSRPAHSGWEDAAVPPEHLGSWLRDFDSLLARHGLDGVPYGHFGDGCVHVRIDFTFDEAGRRTFRSFLEDSADALRAYGGSLSGEHGDGRARSELLGRMYDADSMRLFGAAKAICDPDDLLNPGVLVEPDPLDDHLRPGRRRHREPLPLLRMAHDHGSLGDAVNRCTGVGKCVAGPTPGAVMCPSWQATRDEKDSTRGRARVLQEAVDGTLVDGLADPAVHEALDLCLACKGCARDCPTGVDMATYKAEALHQTYGGRGAPRRPRSHYTLGRLPMWARLTAPVAGLVNAALAAGPLARVAKATAGIDQRRSVPTFARRTLRRGARAGGAGAGRDVLRLPAIGVRARKSPAVSPQSTALLGDDVDAARAVSTETDQHTPDVWIWADSFTDHFLPQTARAAMRVLTEAGLRVRVIDERACCGLTWITTGQLTSARRIMRRTLDTLAPYADSGAPILGLEPSCLATLRSDAAELVDDPADVDRARRVADAAVTFAELATRLDLPLPDLSGVRVVAQPHCHHSSVLGWAADHALLEKAGARVTRVGGCCGLAGNFGVEQGHYETSVAVAETQLLPAVRTALDDDATTVVLADGMSCRLQLDDLADVPAVHLAELWADPPAADPQGRPVTRSGGSG